MQQSLTAMYRAKDSYFETLINICLTYDSTFHLVEAEGHVIDLGLEGSYLCGVLVLPLVTVTCPVVHLALLLRYRCLCQRNLLLQLCKISLGGAYKTF